MLTNSDELNVYLQSAFEHFTRTLSTPFNFVAVSLLNNPINFDFGGHMLQLVNTIAAQGTSISAESGWSSWIFEKMCTMVASCIMLDCARYRKGRVEDLFDSYKKFFEWTLREYCDLWLPCGYSNGEGRYCLLVRARHNTKGHQDEEGIIAHGEYQSSFTAEAFGPAWERQLRSAISVVQRAFQCEQDAAGHNDQVVTDEKIARRLHRQYANEFFMDVGTANRIFSHATCFCCLMDVPEHPLPCGHVICSACVQTYGKTSSKCVIEMPYCPMHMAETRWPKPHVIKFKHKGAGTRILCLDGGGIRGIVELEVLRAIEQALGGEMRVQDFFDLIVGTSTGGIIALALGVQQWPVDQCIDMFTSMCDQAYTPRVKGMPILDLAATISHGSKYKTKEFHDTLKEAFGDKNYLFGGRIQGGAQTQTKVAVTSTTSTGGRAIVIANYRRKEDGEPEYDFERPHEPELEMRVWEAAAATSAAPTYFKPFVNPLTRRTYLDGALQNNNPAKLANRERKLIWPETADVDPDIFLSLGTGQNRISILPKLSSKTTDWRTLQSTLQTAPAEKPKGMSRLLKSWTVLYNRVDDILNAEMAWAAFRQDVVGADRAQRNSRRYIRFNPDLDKRAPSVDAKNELRSLQSTVQKRLSLPHCLTAVQHVAYRLIASSFYLDVSRRLSQADGTYTFVCSVLCKFEDGTGNLRCLGRFLQKTVVNEFRPHFLVKGDARDPEGKAFEISPALIDAMVRDSAFAMPAVNVHVRNEKISSNITLVLVPHDGLEPKGFSISGMPKLLANECSGKHSVRSSSKSSPTSRQPHNNFASNVSRSGTVSLNERPGNRFHWTPTAGPLVGLKQLERADTAPEVTFKPFYIDPVVSYRDVKGPNRFWAYIAPAHMSKNRHLYPQEMLEKFAPAVAAEPIELDGGDDTEIKRVAYAELENASNRLKRTSVHHEVHAESSPNILQRERKDSARDLDDARQTITTIMGDQPVELPSLPFVPPPLPPKRRGFDPGELEIAIQAAFG
jgi:patatin-like phospholipase/acyl hydrolase